MDREIKFRAKCARTGDWKYGFLSNHSTLTINSVRLKIDPNTIGQCTDLKDKKKNDIYEGDILEFVGGTCSFLSLHHYDNKHPIGTKLVVSKLLSGFTLQLPIHVGMDSPNIVGNITNYDFWNHQQSFKIIGNIHDNKISK